MDNIGSMTSLRDDTIKSVRNGKNAHAQRSDEQESTLGSFDSLLVALTSQIVPPSVPVSDTDQQNISQASQPLAAQTSPASQVAQASSSPQQTTSTAPAALASAPATPTGVAAPNAQAGLVQGQGADQAVLAQLASLGTDGPSTVPTTTGTINSLQTSAPQTTPATPILLPTTSDTTGLSQAEPSNVTTNAAMLAASRSNAGAAASANSGLQSGTQDGKMDQGIEASSTSTAPTSTVASNDNGTLLTANKAKPVSAETNPQIPSPLLDPVPTSTDGAGSTSIIAGQEVAVPANDQANRATQLTPHTIPMLAATMMRRFDSGSRQFTMRLDPPELGQVEVKLTVAADKKVRAVVSADRPEALADLVRSARELTRALAEAGLDLEENGLTFTMNDPSAGGQQQSRDHQTATTQHAGSNMTTRLEAETTPAAKIAQTPSDPFERWQRARIALTV